MGERQNGPFQLSFNSSLKVDFQGSRVTSDGGLVLVRELDERLGFGDLVAQHLTDSRRGKNTQLPLADLLRQSVYSRIAGYEDVNDAERVSQDPSFRLIGSEKTWDRGAALTSRLQTFETEMLAEEENFGSLARINRELIGKVEAIDAQQRSGVPSRRGLRQAGDLRGAGRAGREVRHSPSVQRQPGAIRCRVVDPASGTAQLQTGGPVQELSLSGGQLD